MFISLCVSRHTWRWWCQRVLWQLYIFALRRTQRHCLSATQHVINTWMTEESCWSNQLQSRHEGLVHIQKSYFAPSRLVRGEPTALNLQVWVYHYKFGTPRGELQYFYPHRPSCTGYLVQDFPPFGWKGSMFSQPRGYFLASFGPKCVGFQWAGTDCKLQEWMYDDSKSSIFKETQDSWQETCNRAGEK